MAAYELVLDIVEVNIPFTTKKGKKTFKTLGYKMVFTAASKKDSRKITATEARHLACRQGDTVKYTINAPNISGVSGTGGFGIHFNYSSVDGPAASGQGTPANSRKRWPFTVWSSGAPNYRGPRAALPQDRNSLYKLVDTSNTTGPWSSPVYVVKRLGTSGDTHKQVRYLTQLHMKINTTRNNLGSPFDVMEDPELYVDEC